MMKRWIRKGKMFCNKGNELMVSTDSKNLITSFRSFQSEHDKVLIKSQANEFCIC